MGRQTADDRTDEQTEKYYTYFPTKFVIKVLIPLILRVFPFFNCPISSKIKPRQKKMTVLVYLLIPGYFRK
jgi:hypothetical protein